MNKELNIIRSYAIDSLNYGRKSGNKAATQRGSEVMYACDKIEEFYGKITNVLDHTKAQQIALDKIESNMVDVYASKLSPDKFDSHTDWLQAIDKFFYE